MRAIEIPETREQQIAWLEAELLGTGLHVLAAELEAVHSDSSDCLTLNEETIFAVRERGLVVLSEEQLRGLLVNGHELLKLQSDVLQNGGAYWSNVRPPADSPVPARFENQTATVSRKTDRHGSQLATNILWATVGSLATAAALLLFANPFAAQPTVAPKVAETETPVDDQVENLAVEMAAPAQRPVWGFEKFALNVVSSEENLDPPLSREAYLRELATAAGAWKNKRPDNSRDLAQRIGEFRMGCSAILLAEHGPLMEADRVWLRERCRSWASALDRHLADVEMNTPVEQVIGEVDSTVTKIAAALLGRADTAAG